MIKILCIRYIYIHVHVCVCKLIELKSVMLLEIQCCCQVSGFFCKICNYSLKSNQVICRDILQHILFCLQSMVQKYLSKPIKVDSIAFMLINQQHLTVQHDVLWYVLSKNGLHGRCQMFLRVSTVS